ncbi:hypothetical protein Alches_13740 [Alicyclobacillus hesperidum subsp. aegles]|uniref:hypothetical protein n=1 Tax=Alicyclobacillus hesperidum TaxID=89784 RepID=UPI0007194264|nr:hypothetical protein [Alicyclobacillus hesperidum]KRW91273.1 hypothetical protein SD51_09980 [Alicyclobacillus tengchongensis]GLG01335.1 hypothetical protein Alches_13740 [Alicyclobacillus hesperidum subsp. aegles]
MSVPVRLMFFGIALFTMALLAAGATLMAVGHHGWLSALSYVIGILLAGVGFMLRRRFIKPTAAE